MLCIPNIILTYRLSTAGIHLSFDLFPWVLEWWSVFSSPKFSSMTSNLRSCAIVGTSTHFLCVLVFSQKTSIHFRDLKSRMKRGLHNSCATPRSLQHLISAFDLAPSVAVATPEGSKYSCSPLAVDTNLYNTINSVHHGDRLPTFLNK